MKDIFAGLYNKIVGFFSSTEHVEDESKNVARNRLKLVLMQDRTNLNPYLLERMRGELIDLLSKYVEMDREALDLNFENEGDSVALMLSIPVIRAKEEQEIEEALKAEDEAKKEIEEKLKALEEKESTEEGTEEDSAESEEKTEEEESETEETTAESENEEVVEEPSQDETAEVEEVVEDSTQEESEEIVEEAVEEEQAVEDKEKVEAKAGGKSSKKHKKK